jgi:hypothetical protein
VIVVPAEPRTASAPAASLLAAIVGGLVRLQFGWGAQLPAYPVLPLIFGRIAAN